MENDYRTGRFMARIVTALGWLMVAGGFLGLLLLLALRLTQQPNPDPLSVSIWAGVMAYAVPVMLAVMVQGVFFVTLGRRSAPSWTRPGPRGSFSTM